MKACTRTALACLVAGSIALGLRAEVGDVTVAHASSPYTLGIEGGDHALHANHGGGFINLGGSIIAAPAVVSAPINGGTADLYIATAIDHQLWERTDGHGWQLLASGYCLDNPAATVVGTTLTVACLGGNHGLWYGTTTIPTSGLPTLGGFSNLGGVTYYGPAVAPINGTPSFFVVGTDSHLYWRTAGQGWLPFGSESCSGHPAAATAGSTSYVACRTLGGTPVDTVNTGSGWAAFTSLGGVAVNGPGVAATGSGATFVIEGGNGAVYQKSVSINGSSTGWQNLGGIAVNGAGATADGTSTSPPSSSNPIQQMLGLVNTDRTNAGLPPYTLNMTQSSGTATCVGSYGHSVAMAQSGSIWHVNPSYPQASFPNNICISYSIAGENVGMSQSGSETNDLQTINNLMMSEPHDASTCATTVNHACNILSTAFHQVGIGIYYANNTTWLTEDFTN